MHPQLVTAIPGPESLRLARELRKYESRNVTYLADDWPVFWDRAEGHHVWDVDGNRFVDLTSAFGVAGFGHSDPAVVTAMQQQSQKLIHGMGDVHPTALKSQLCRELSEITWGRWTGEKARVTLSNSGFESVETALKTAVLASGRPGILSFKNSYHGLGYGALLGTGLEAFRTPFADQLADVRQQLTFPRHDLDALRNELEHIDPTSIGALIVEPIQGRGGKLVPPAGFLQLLRDWCDASGAVLIFDEIYTGFHRTGRTFACEWEGVVPDLICIGKALSGGYPISACVGSQRVMDAWPESPGEALHTSTFLGNPVGCAMALAALEKHRDTRIDDVINATGDWLQTELRKRPVFTDVRGRGLMIGAEMLQKNSVGPAITAMLAKGYLMLGDGPDGNVLAFTPPFEMPRPALEQMLQVLDVVL